jgi:hypothetical protein
MTRSSLYPDPPHVSAAVYADALAPEEAFRRICDLVAGQGAIPTGLTEWVAGSEFPSFMMISDLAARTQTARQDLKISREHALWTQWIGGLSADRRVLRTGFGVPRVGTAVVEYQPAAKDDPERRHPVAITVSGALLSMPPTAGLSKTERKTSAATAAWLVGAFRRVCETLDPLYGAIATEAWLPVPVQLVSGHARLGTEVFVSDRLEQRAPGMAARLTALYAPGFVERWANGCFLSGWAAMNAPGRTLTEPLKAGTRAAAIVASAFR